MEPALLRVSDLGIGVATDASVVPVVQEVGFQLDRGRTLCLVGNSGCGKSVTARAILRLVDPPLWITPGSRVRFGNTELTNLPEAALRDVRGRDIAMIFQEPMSALNPVLTIGAQIVETLSGIAACAAATRGASHRAVAGGRHCLSRAVHPSVSARTLRRHAAAGADRRRGRLRAKVLIADEPTTALDLTVQAQILELLREMQERADGDCC